MRKIFLLFAILTLLGVSFLFAYDTSRVYTQYFGMSDGKVCKILGDEHEAMRSQSGKNVFVYVVPRGDKYYSGLAVNLLANDDWILTGYETYQFGQSAWEDSTIQTILSSELTYLQENGWKITNKSKNDYDKFDYVLRKGEEDTITITFFNHWNFRVEQNIKSAFDKLFE